jgi:UDP-N-acetylmuramate: L-alanyl-gamma-D-glutamyl-meso-diaminopimelate ligase
VRWSKIYWALKDILGIMIGIIGLGYSIRQKLMHIHILGICGTFMGSLAVLAKELGYRVSGSDQNVYPPMSTQLEEAGIELIQGYDPAQLKNGADLIVVGNAMSRGNPAVEYMLNHNLPYTSGPQWLAEHVLKDKWVLAVAGTHGKTTTASMLAWILEYAGMRPGYLIGGVPKNFDVSARLGDTDFFVIEADEYDTAFFDKRSKFVHYKPRTAVLNNLEFDHADIFENLTAIQRQFHHLVRIVPADGRIIVPQADPTLGQVLEMGCWTPVETVGDDGANWSANPLTPGADHFSVSLDGEQVGNVSWVHGGQHNMNNALMAIAAARHVGVVPEQAVAALCDFEGVKRRMETIGEVEGVTLYDDFAHHPTAIETTLDGLRKRVGVARIFAIIEPRSNTMRLGVYKNKLATVCADADEVLWFQPPGVDWDLQSVAEASPVPAEVFQSTEAIIERICAESAAGDHVVIMSNGGFEGIHQRLLAALEHRSVNREVAND